MVLLDFMERETGIELATSSLGNSLSIENRESERYGINFRRFERLEFSAIFFGAFASGVLMEYPACSDLMTIAVAMPRSADINLWCPPSIRYISSTHDSQTNDL